MAKKMTDRKPPVHIPIDFEKAIEGFLGVDPKEPIAKPAKEKPGRKK